MRISALVVAFLFPFVFVSSASAQDALHTRAGVFSIGLNTVFNYARASNELSDGTLEKNSTLFLRTGPMVEYFAADSLPIRVSAQWLRRRLAREQDNAAAENDALFLIGTGFHLPATARFAIIFGADVGGYFGSSERPQLVMDSMGTSRLVTEKTSTAGLGVAGEVGASYLFSDHAQFRAGVTYTGLFGSETITSTQQSLAVTTHNAGLNVAIIYVF